MERTHSPVSPVARLARSAGRLPVDLLLLLEHVRHAAVRGVVEDSVKSLRGDRGAARTRLSRHGRRGVRDGHADAVAERGRGDARCWKGLDAGWFRHGACSYLLLRQPGLFRRVLLPDAVERRSR